MEAEGAAGTGRYCPGCRAIYQGALARCPNDGRELEPFEGDPIVGTQIKDYLLEEFLGEGATGRVYRARHVRLSRRNYAVKILLGDLAMDETMRTRFAQEADAASRIDHPNLVAVHDFGRTEAGLFYIVMEYVSGQTLAQLIDSCGRLRELDTVLLCRAICNGLAHAHERGLVHRDFKPENVVVVEQDGALVPRILDFGLAIVKTPGETSARLTATGAIVGTPAYAAPEQISVEDVDARTDLFALGVSMYEMLAGRLPFDGGIMDVLVANASKDPPPIAERCGVPVSPALEAIVTRLMAKHRDQRFASARELGAALDQVAATLGWQAPLSGPIRLQHGGVLNDGQGERQGTRRWRVLLFVALFVLVGSGAGVALALTLQGGESRVAAADTAAADIPSEEPGNTGSEDELGGEDSAQPTASAAGERDAALPGSEPSPSSQASSGPSAETSAGGETRAAAGQDEDSGARRATGGTVRVAERGDRSRNRPATSRSSTTRQDDGDPKKAPERRTSPDPEPEGTAEVPDPPEREPEAKPEPGPVTRPEPVEPPATKKPALDARTSVGGLQSRGSLPASQIRKAVRAVVPKLRPCYRNAARRAGGDQAMKVAVAFRIDETRRARGISVSGAKLPGLAACIKDAAGGIRTRRPPDIGSQKVSFSILYRPLPPR